MSVTTVYCFLLLISPKAFGQKGKECERQFMQRCDTCTVRDDICMTISEQRIYVTDHCRELCERNPSCLLAEYHPVVSTCKLYDCLSLMISKGYTSVSFRKACSEDCNKFELTLENQRNASISACTLSDLGRISNLGCMAKCFDTEDCRALIYPNGAYDCMLCSSADVMAFDEIATKLHEARLMRRICITDKPTIYTQICLNCNKGTLCQDSFEEPEVINESSCKDVCDTYTDCKLAVYNQKEDNCKLYNCGLVQENADMEAYRKSSSEDCPVYQITTFNGSLGTCNVLAESYTVPYSEYCFDKCLDMPGCRGASYTEGKNCSLHDCDSYMPARADKIFMKRSCIAGPIVQHPSPITVRLESSNLSNQPAKQFVESTSTNSAASSEKEASVSNHESFFGNHRYIVVVSVTSGVIALSCVGLLTLYVLVCRKKKIQPHSLK